VCVCACVCACVCMCVCVSAMSFAFYRLLNVAQVVAPDLTFAVQHYQEAQVYAKAHKSRTIEEMRTVVLSSAAVKEAIQVPTHLACSELIWIAGKVLAHGIGLPNVAIISTDPLDG
jgi:hypothetical protein